MSSQDWLEKDYYKILGVDRTAKPDEIKKAFRAIAKDNHPDANPGNKAAEKRFKDASEAHSVLGDAEKRKEYDQARSLLGGGGFRFPRTGPGQRPGPNVDDLFRNASNAGSGENGFGDLFGGLFTPTARSGRSSAGRPRRGADVDGEVTVDFTDAIEGTTVAMQTVSDAPCRACQGTGAKAGSMPTVCRRCEGSGMISSTSGGVFSVNETCPDCHGRGLTVDDPCPVCAGTGRATSTRSMQVRVPRGVADGSRIRVKGKGAPGENGGDPGDLFVKVHVRAHRIFGRKGDALTVTVPVTFPEAALGAEVQVPTLGGLPVTLRVPAGTPSGRTFRVRGKGAPRKTGGPGDLLVTVDVVVPTSLDAEAKAALEAYRAVAAEADPRADLLAGSAG